MSSKKAVERLDSLKSLQEMDLGENQYVAVSTLVEVVSENLDRVGSVSEDVTPAPKGVCDDPEIPGVFRQFLRRFSGTDGVDGDEPEYELR